MYKRCTSYTLVSQPPTEKALINQGCIKSCILRKKNPCQSPSAIRVLFWYVYRKETLRELAYNKLQLTKRILCYSKGFTSVNLYKLNIKMVILIIKLAF